MINIFYSLFLSYTLLKPNQLTPLLPITYKRFYQINVKESNIFNEDRSYIISTKLENFQKERDKITKKEKEKDNNKNIFNILNLKYKRGDEPDN